MLSVFATRKRTSLKGRPFSMLSGSVDLGLDLGRLAHAVAQVVQLGSADFAAANGLHGDDAGRMDGEDLLAAHTVGNAPHGDGLVDAAMLSGDDGALERLGALAAAFLDAKSDANGVAHVHLRQLGLHVVCGKRLNEIHDDPSFIHRRSYRRKRQRTVRFPVSENTA